jgi:hypothetical protein
METQTAIWPFDTLNDLRTPERTRPDRLECFLISPFTPKDQFDDLHNLIQDVCNAVGEQLQCQLKCERADKIAGPGVIHYDIWFHIQTADVVIIDVTGLNGNVMIELGVAAACRKKENVIIIKEDNPAEKFLFDIGPARHILYKRTSGGFKELSQTLLNTLLISLASAPFETKPKTPINLPLNVDFTKAKDVDWLVGPSITHRRITADYLEFGSLFVFRNSWLSVANLELSNFEITAEMKFSQLRNVTGWIGISVRNQNFFANYGHLLYLASNGDVVFTVPENDIGGYHGEPIGTIPNFDPMKPEFFRFRIEAGEQTISMSVNGVGREFRVAEMPFVFPSGRILFQTYVARAGIRRIEIKERQS